MQEIERKILGIDKRAVIANLRKLGARRTFSGLVRVRYFDYPDGRIRKKHDLLRLREFLVRGRPAYCEIVYKTFLGVRDGCKCVDETELKLPGAGTFETALLLMKKMGFEQTKHYEKKRDIFAYKKWKFEFDEYPGIPVFLEIEADSPGAIEQAIRLLHLEKYEQSADSISNLLKKKYPGVKLDGLVFKN